MNSELKVGNKYLILTPTAHYWIGELLSATMIQINLIKSAWIPEVGSKEKRHHGAICQGELSEIEMHPPEMVIRLPGIAAGSIVMDWLHELPTQSK